MIIINQV